MQPPRAAYAIEFANRKMPAEEHVRAIKSYYGSRFYIIPKIYHKYRKNW